MKILVTKKKIFQSISNAGRVVESLTVLEICKKTHSYRAHAKRRYIIIKGGRRIKQLFCQVMAVCINNILILIRIPEITKNSE
jgi:hypothetical protein